MKSIVQGDREGCFWCGKEPTEEHHIFGGPNRDLSDKYKLTVDLCPYHHRDSKGGVHFNPEFKETIQRYGREAFEREYPDLDFDEIFKKGLL